MVKDNYGWNIGGFGKTGDINNKGLSQGKVTKRCTVKLTTVRAGQYLYL